MSRYMSAGACLVRRCSGWMDEQTQLAKVIARVLDFKHSTERKYKKQSSGIFSGAWWVFPEPVVSAPSSGLVSFRQSLQILQLPRISLAGPAYAIITRLCAWAHRWPFSLQVRMHACRGIIFTLSLAHSRRTWKAQMCLLLCKKATTHTDCWSTHGEKGKGLLRHAFGGTFLASVFKI